MTKMFDDYGNMEPWPALNWRQRIIFVLVWLVGGAISVVGAILLIAVFGMMIEGIGRHSTEHDRCLKNATNGYEIKQCR